MIQLLIIADDFTGALDTGVQFAICGAKIRVITNIPAGMPKDKQEAEVLVIDAETRHMPAKQAYEAIKQIVGKAECLRIPYIYKKTDSALRGNIGAELTALMDASGEAALAFLPAFPQMGRNTVEGIHYINGVPVAESVFGNEPFNPVRHSGVAELIHEQSGVRTHHATSQNTEMGESGIYIFDSSSVEDLYRIGKALFEKRRLHIMAGCAGFGAVLPKLLGVGREGPARMPKLSGRLLVVCGSINPITASQLDRAENAGFKRYRLTPQQKLDEDYWEQGHGAGLVAELWQELEENRHMIIDSNDPEDIRLSTEAYGRRHGIGLDEMRVNISRTLGRIVDGLFTNPALGTLFIVGGDTLLQCMNTMGVYEMEPVGEISPGVVLSRFSYRNCTRYVISKSGGFGNDMLLVDLAKMLECV